MIRVDASRQEGVASLEVAENLFVLDDVAFGTATDVAPKLASPVDPAARWTAASGKPDSYACDNYLIDLECAVRDY